MIPKIIHYCWFGRSPKPDSVLFCIESWRQFCPDYEIIEWNESNYDYTVCNYMRQAYEAKKWSFVTDYARLDIIYRYGGFYFDTDVELIKPLDSLLNHNAFMGFDNTPRENHFVASGLGFGAEKGNQLIKEMMEDYDGVSFLKEDGSFNILPCPHYNTACLKRHGLVNKDEDQLVDGMVIYASDVFCPKNFFSMKLKLTDRTISIHHFDASWMDESNKRKRARRMRMISLFGDSIGNSISNSIDDVDFLLVRIKEKLERKYK